MHGRSQFRLCKACAASYLVYSAMAPQSLVLGVWLLEHEVYANNIQLMLQLINYD
jgi:hypothetical protein